MSRIIFLALFFAVSALHLYGCIRGNNRLCTFTKPALLPLLAAYYLLNAPSPNGFLVAALLFSWLGDVLLMVPGDVWFTCGGVAFIISHALFIPAYLPQISPGGFSPATLIPVSAVYCIAAGTVIYVIRNSVQRWMRVPLFLYLICNGAMNVFALMQLMSVLNTGAIVVYAGAVLFFVSDCTLFFLCFGKKDAKHDILNFIVMLTYILGEWLITHGMTMIS